MSITFKSSYGNHQNESSFDIMSQMMSLWFTINSFKYSMLQTMIESMVKRIRQGLVNMCQYPMNAQAIVCVLIF